MAEALVSSDPKVPFIVRTVLEEHTKIYRIRTSIEVHLRRHNAYQTRPWQPTFPKWISGVEPNDEDTVIEKNGQNAFCRASLDFHLRRSGIETLLCVGFTFKLCLFYTLIGAFEHNYRVVFLRDGANLLGENEFLDTSGENLPEKVRLHSF